MQAQQAQRAQQLKGLSDLTRARPPSPLPGPSQTAHRASVRLLIMRLARLSAGSSTQLPPLPCMQAPPQLAHLPIVRLARLVAHHLWRQVGGRADAAGGRALVVCVLAEPKVSQLQASSHRNARAGGTGGSSAAAAQRRQMGRMRDWSVVIGNVVSGPACIGSGPAGVHGTRAQERSPSCRLCHQHMLRHMQHTMPRPAPPRRVQHTRHCAVLPMLRQPASLPACQP